MSLKNKLLILVLIPLLFMLLFAARTTLNMSRQAREMNSLAELATVSARIGALVHEMQKERGMSAGFIGSKGANFAAELPKQRLEVDKRKAELEQQLAGFHAAEYGGGLQQNLAEAGKRLVDLSVKRQAVTALSISGPEAIGYYTNTIGGLLMIVGQTASLSSDAGVTRLAAAYGGLLQGKESAGIERATLSNVLGADKFSQEMLVRFLSVSSAQDTWIKVFHSYASRDQAEFFKTKVTGPAVDEVLKIKKAAMEKMNESSLGIDAKYWFAKSTERIDLINEVEKRLAADLTNTAEKLRDEARSMVLISLVLTIFAIGLTVLAAHRLIRGILGQLGGEPSEAVRVARAIEEGKLDNEIVLRRGDTDSLLADMKSMQEQLRDRIAAERATADTNLRIRIALDNVSTGVMIADPDRKIIYTNKSVQRILKGAEDGIRKQLPNFDADKMMGINIDSFHKNPKHQADLLAKFTNLHVANLEIGGRHLRVSASPVINDRNERLGAVAEWLDRTDEIRVEREVAEMVQGAQKGNFEMRLSIDGKEGFFKQLSVGLNALADVTSTGLKDVAQILQAVSHGDLTRRIEGEYSGIFGQLKDDSNTTVDCLREVVGRIKEATDLINTAAKEIAAGNTDLSSRTEEQASSLQETASSMEELNSTVKQNAENANQANLLARSSNDTAVKSGQVVQQIVTTMNGISQSSKKIADIIGVIDSIAFQTNILALNAAVEAARAGEQGRGFAVVATEVRNLAHRSATAAKEIKELIAESTRQVEDGTKLVDQAGASMTTVVSSFQQVTGLVTDIANASREQASGIEQVTKAVGQMDEVTQQNAALVEQAAAAAESLEEQARGLLQAVSMFKLTEGAPRNLMPTPALRDVTPRHMERVRHQTTIMTPK
jgi:methyl-accepting chemotaxis protein